MVELAHARDGDEKAAADVEQGEREGFYRAAQMPELASLRQKESVEKNLENENCEKNADLERQVASERPARGSLELVAALKLVAFELQNAQMPAQAVQLVPALRRILLCFDALDDPVFDIVEGNAVGGRFFPRAALGAGRRKPHVCGELLDTQRREDFQRRPIIVLLALQPVKEASKRGPLRRFHNPYVGQSLRATPPSTAATLELPVSRNRPAIWAEVVEPRGPAP